MVVSVDYRTAPNHHFPAMFEDGKAVTRWVLMNKSLIGGLNDYLAYKDVLQCDHQMSCIVELSRAA